MHNQLIQELLKQIQPNYKYTIHKYTIHKHHHNDSIIVHIPASRPFPASLPYNPISIHIYLTEHHLIIRPCDYHNTCYEQQIALADPDIVKKAQKIAQNHETMRNIINQITIIQQVIKDVSNISETTLTIHKEQTIITATNPHNHITLAIQNPKNQPQLAININNHTTTIPLENQKENLFRIHAYTYIKKHLNT